jgi:type I restriction enzyme S subunit
MKKYQSYKHSGVEWIGEIPERWSVTKIKYSKKDSKNSFIDGDWIESKDLSDVGIRYITSGNIGEGKYKEQGSGYISEDTFNELNCTEIFEGDLVISRLFLPVGRSCILPNLNNRIVTCVDNVVLRPKETFNKYYLNYQFNSSRYSEFTELISRGVTLTRISRGMLGNNSIVVPPLLEQNQIVQFLDEKTELIDKLISTKERKITLLKEQRTSIINQTVTRGINPNVKMKDSGVEWIGEIPEHWVSSKVKYISRIFGRIGYRGYTVEDIVEEGNGVITISPSNIKNDIFTIEGENTYLSFEKYYESPEIQIFPNDIILVKTGSTIGKTSIIPNCVPEMTINPQLVVLKEIKIIHKYFYFQTVCEFFKKSFFVEQTGSTTPTISQEKINNFPVLIPTREEQNQIVSFLDSKTKEIDDMVSMEQRKIDLLKEYRQSLISEVVTGKIKVTTD